VGLTTGPIRSPSEGFVGIFELGTVAEWDGTLSKSPTTVGGGRGAAGGGGGAAETVGFGASQEPSGTRAAATALPVAVAVVRAVVPHEDEDEEANVAAKGRGAEGETAFGGVGVAELRIAAMSTFPTGV
jgi:hypothetical protein